MKSLKLFLIAAICLGTVTTVNAQRKRIKGSGDIITETRDVKNFTGVSTSTAIDIYLTQGNDFEVVVEADDNLMEYIITEVDNGVLKVRFQRGINVLWSKRKVVHISMKEVDLISASSAGDVIGQSPIEAGDLKIRTSSAGDVKLEVYAKSLDLGTSSSGDITLSGEADYLEAKTSSAGDIKAFELTVKEADIHASSAGDVKITVSDRLYARASSAGDIQYRGNPPKVDAKSSSAGDVIKR